MSSLTLLSLLSLSIPGTIQPINAVILNFVYLDFLFADAWLLPAFDFDSDNDTPLSPYFDELGFFSINLVANIGSGFLFIIIVAFIFLLHLLITLIGKYCFRR